MLQKNQIAQRTRNITTNGVTSAACGGTSVYHHLMRNSHKLYASMTDVALSLQP